MATPMILAMLHTQMMQNLSSVRASCTHASPLATLRNLKNCANASRAYMTLVKNV